MSKTNTKLAEDALIDIDTEIKRLEQFRADILAEVAEKLEQDYKKFQERVKALQRSFPTFRPSWEPASTVTPNRKNQLRVYQFRNVRDAIESILPAVRREEELSNRELGWPHIEEETVYQRLLNLGLTYARATVTQALIAARENWKWRGYSIPISIVRLKSGKTGYAKIID